MFDKLCMSTPVVILPPSDPSLGCNCQYPIGLCCILKKNDNIAQRKSSSFDSRLFDTSKFIDGKHSLDPHLLEYTKLLSSSNCSSNSRSIDLGTTGMYAGDTSLVTTNILSII
uniref:Ovule protein n=1 Tax=Heterorhabditis bacteriophora TaxID=37862 RepID=A0A1I7WYR4_HETBA